jgi:hypothetical protein
VSRQEAIRAMRFEQDIRKAYARGKAEGSCSESERAVLDWIHAASPPGSQPWLAGDPIPPTLADLFNQMGRK